MSITEGVNLTMAHRAKRRKGNITQQDIDDGVPNHPTLCSVALSSARMFHDAEKVRIISGLLHVFFDDEIWYYRLPRTISCIPTLVDLNEKHAAEPVPFTLDRPVIAKRKKHTKPITVREHKRSLPGDAHHIDPLTMEEAPKDTSARACAARMRRHLRQMGMGSRYAGNDI